MELKDIDMLLDPALFQVNANPSPPACACPDFDVPQYPHPHSLNISASASVLESETSQSVASTMNTEPILSLPSTVPREQLQFVKVQYGSDIQIKRPANSFMLYRSDQIQAMKAANPRAKVTREFTQTISKQWNQEKASVKQQYAQRARDLADLHTKNFPDYKYSPRRNPKQG
ncbi:hypothetical protein N0V82_001461 [Gnomoniopsis sp. IMI 355080]|nr:hypothetical protein N0V82_001461 [Gnomoniopsis sp. IMI 355080]